MRAKDRLQLDDAQSSFGINTKRKLKRIFPNKWIDKGDPTPYSLRDHSIQHV